MSCVNVFLTALGRHLPRDLCLLANRFRVSDCLLAKCAEYEVWAVHVCGNAWCNRKAEFRIRRGLDVYLLTTVITVVTGPRVNMFAVGQRHTSQGCIELSAYPPWRLDPSLSRGLELLVLPPRILGRPYLRPLKMIVDHRVLAIFAAVVAQSGLDPVPALSCHCQDCHSFVPPNPFPTPLPRAPFFRPP